MEMFYCSNTPMINERERIENFEGELKKDLLKGRRVHMIYGEKERSRMKSPLVLPPLKNDHFFNYHPLKGNFSVESDRIKIEELINQLLPFMKFEKEFYEGETNSKGEKHGNGNFF
jgi:hypothetical protein